MSRKGKGKGKQKKASPKKGKGKSKKASSKESKPKKGVKPEAPVPSEGSLAHQDSVLSGGDDSKEPVAAAPAPELEPPAQMEVGVGTFELDGKTYEGDPPVPVVGLKENAGVLREVEVRSVETFAPEAQQAPPAEEAVSTPEPVPAEEAKPRKRRAKKEKPPKPRDLQMWVGAMHYPTIESFIDEAQRMGVSKRVSRPPLDATLGETLLFLVHDEGKRIECQACDSTGVAGGKLEIQLMAKTKEPDQPGCSWSPVEAGSMPAFPEVRKVVTSGSEFKEMRDALYKESKETMRWDKVPDQQRCERCKGWGKYPDGKIFGFCRISAVELVLDAPETVKEFKAREAELQKEGKVEVTPVVGGQGVEAERGCGFRQIGGYYLVSGTKEALEELQALATSFGAKFAVRGSFVELEKPVPYPHHRFFGTKLIDRKDVFGA